MRRFSCSVHLALTISVFLAFAIFPTSAGAANVEPLPPDSTYSGMKMVDWEVAYSQWFWSIPRASNPGTAYDVTGANSGVGQRAPVWFIPGTPAAIDTRTFAIPEGQAILFIPAFETTVNVAGAVTDDELLAAEDTNADFLNHIAPQVSLDGVPIPDVRRYRVRTPLFSMTLPPDNVFNIPADAPFGSRVAAVTDGFVIMFPPLPVGKHVLDHRSPPGDPNNVHWTFNLIVQKPNEPLQ